MPCAAASSPEGPLWPGKPPADGSQLLAFSGRRQVWSRCRIIARQVLHVSFEHGRILVNLKSQHCTGGYDGRDGRADSEDSASLVF